MLKVLIADDEKKITCLIENLVDWEALGLKVVMTANNGMDALQFIRDNMPDIVIADIRMPGLDGIDLVKASSELGYKGDFIIISGYKKFEYAFNAVKYNVSDYLLKPIKKKELISALTKICDKSVAIETHNNEQFQLENQANRKMLHMLFFERYIFQGDIIPSVEVANKEYCLHFIRGSYVAIYFKVDIDRERNSDFNLENLKSEAMIAFQRLFSPCCFFIADYILPFGGCILLNFSDSMDTEIRRCLREFLKEIKIIFGKFNSLKSTIGVGQIYYSISGLRDSFQEAQTALKERLLSNEDKLIYFGEVSNEGNISDAVLNDLFSPQDYKKLEIGIETMDYSIIKECIQKALSYYEKCKKPALLYAAFDTILDTMKNSVLYKGVSNGEINSTFDSILDEMDKVGTAPQLATSLEIGIIAALEKRQEEKQLRDNKPIRLAKQYISENYSEKLSLESVAEYVGLNSSYFSAFFKKRDGN